MSKKWKITIASQPEVMNKRDKFFQIDASIIQK